MPLEHSKSKAAVGRNIEREEAAGKPHKQAVAIALSEQRRAADDGRYVVPGNEGRRKVR